MMLRRKMVVIFSSLVALMLVTAVGAIWTLQGILKDLRHLDSEARVVAEDANNLGTTISMVEIELYELELGRKRHLDTLIDLVDKMQQQLSRIEASYVSHLPDGQPVLERIQTRLQSFWRDVATLGTAQDPVWAAQHRRTALGTAVALRQDILILSRNIRSHGELEQSSVTARFRWLVLALTVVFLVTINVAVIVLLRMAGMILRPVEKLVEATRQLGQEHFGYRVELDQKDEFDQLARAYNNLASQLQTNEQRKLEMLGQVALTLTHELNNVAAIIELQVKLLSRQAGANSDVEKYGRQIHESLARMTRTVEQLKRVRRIVLTDYISGVKMLDLERSVEETGQKPAGEEAPALTQTSGEEQGS